MAKMEIDLRLACFITIYKQLEKKIITNEVKQAIRNNNYTTKFDTYGKITLGKNTRTQYKKGDKIIELDTTKIIEDYCKANDIDIVKEIRDNYKVEIVPSEKAVNEFNKMLKEQENSQYRNIAKVANQLRNTVK